ncbi:hypothetical protein, unlikely [Trypanosoma brucei gambiense DAL972]|uniref:Uncharacterized protein n=1 Tax=Trypanosoma brucei gambiense (strain MHOM/CI/86/DAL972) TaxID=679716 RepID=D0A6K5_TRYB9|nr:hypothetical protein, unlikely [Trypanosoma brucei gambiense DAL972]CBH17306.1 hypothetical protein, unlikely [Trypanosoma brucei gambiense DAL972]|eukprot:XP_011779570.1 hypothetical protein, unlikely [Trypanosoma brucei gambiense DAL972]
MRRQQNRQRLKASNAASSDEPSATRSRYNRYLSAITLPHVKHRTGMIIYVLVLFPLFDFPLCLMSNNMANSLTIFVLCLTLPTPLKPQLILHTRQCFSSSCWPATGAISFYFCRQRGGMSIPRKLNVIT